MYGQKQKIFPTESKIFSRNASEKTKVYLFAVTFT